MRPASMGLLTLFLGITAIAATSGCRPGGGSGSGAVCEQDSECAADEPSKPHCFQSVCVECFQDDQCGCHEICNDSVCEPFGASSTNRTLNAHGNWSGNPGSEGYTFQDTCKEDADCAIGESCNPLTKGCITAAEFTQACDSEGGCPAGPNGEMLACEPQSQRCLPAATCTGDYNCCGIEGFMCDSGTQVCRPQQNECTPPTADEITSTCPLQPRVQDTCPVGHFCSMVGECVQCTCDQDCNAGGSTSLKCHLATLTCKTADYCDQSSDCNQPEEICDTSHNECVSYCDEENEGQVCNNEEYCADDHVCRPRSERPCTEDSFAPNGNAESAATLTIPSVDHNHFEEDLSVCGAESDWFKLTLSRGDRITITMSSLSGLTANYDAIAPDGTTSIASGFLGDLGSELLDFTANSDGVHYLRITATDNTTGFYNLNISRSVGQTCDDAFEATASNDLPDNASSLYDHQTPATLQDGCDLETTGEDAVVTCEAQALKLCPNDVDYYSIRVPTGASVQATITDYSGDVDLRLFGPFDDEESFTSDRETDSDTGIALSKSVSTIVRSGGLLYFQVAPDFGGATNYSLEVSVNTPASTCTEDLYDQTSSADGAGDVVVSDPPGINDTHDGATHLGLVADGDVEINLTLCPGDTDWFVLGLDSGSAAVTSLPAGYRLQVNVESDPAGTITVAAGTTAASLNLGSDDMANPANSITVPITAEGGYIVKVAGTSTTNAPISYTMSAILTAPPSCTDDGSDDAPASATAVSPPGWSSAGDSHDHPESGQIALCANDDDWYRIAVPDGAELVLTASYDPSQTEVGLTLYDGTVSDLQTPTHDSPPTTGVLSSSEIPSRSFQTVRGIPGSGGYAYARVYNRGGWPLDGYSLTAQLISTTCTSDAYENNDTAAAATTLALERQSYQSQLDFGMFDPLSSCGSDPDWYSVALNQGDRLDAFVYYSRLEADLDLYLYSPNDTAAAIASDMDNAPSIGTLAVSHTVSSNDSPGNYMLKVSPWSGDARYYSLELRVERACIDDPLEPTTSSGWALASLPTTLTDLVLCNDEDWYELTVPAETTVTVCASFTHDDGDIDMEVLSTRTGGALVASSASKNDLESVELTSVSEDTTYYIHLFLDASQPTTTSYSLAVAEGADCPLD